MKKSIINLKHPQHIDIKHPIFRSSYRGIRISLLTQLSQQTIIILMSYLRLAQIIILYNSIKYSHKYEDIKRSILNYLILTNRIYTKWEQKQYLDFILQQVTFKQSIQVQKNRLYQAHVQDQHRQKDRQQNNSKYNNNRQQNNRNNLYINLQQIRNYKYNPSLHITPINSNSQISNHTNGDDYIIQQHHTKNNNQNIKHNHYTHSNNNSNSNSNSNNGNVRKNNYNNFKQSIVYDVNRTYFKKTRQNWYKNKDNNKDKDKDIKDREYKTITNTNNNNGQQHNKMRVKTDENKNINNNIYNSNQNTDRTNNPYFITVSTQQSHATLHPQNNNSNNSNSLPSHTHTNSNTNTYNNNNNNINNNNSKFRLSASSQNSHSHTHTHTQSYHHLISNQTNQQNISTNSQIQYFSSQQQKMQIFLKNVLLNISQKYQILGYIQGFNYIVKNMYITGFTQEQSYKYLSYFIEYKQLGNIILNNMLGIKQLSYVLKVYIFNYIPILYKYLIKLQLQPEIFCTSWFITLFSQQLNNDIINKLWHIFILEGWKMFIKFGISLLCAYQNQILSKGIDQIFSYMRKIINQFNYQIKDRYKKSKYIRNYITKKQQTVWKLMISVEVNDNIMNQLCKEMNNLQKDSEIEIWRLQSNKINNPQQIRNKRIFSQKSLSLQDSNLKNDRLSYFNYDKKQNKLSNSLNLGLGQRLCCDRIVYVDDFDKQQKKSDYITPPRNNMFAMCHNVGAYQ